MLKNILCFFVLLSVVPAFGNNMVDSWLDFWHATVKGNIGDTGNQGAIDFRDSNYQFGLRAYEGRSISSLIYTQYNMTEDLFVPVSFKNKTFNKYKLGGYRVDFQVRNLLFEDSHKSFRWIYGFSHVAHQHELKNSLNEIGSYKPGAWMPTLGLEGRWYLHPSLTLKASMLYSEYNIRKDEVRLKDLDAGLYYMPTSSIDIGLGYRKSFYDMKRDADVGFSYNIGGPYMQMNWLF